MPSVILAGTTTGTALSLTSDTSGELQIRTNNGSTTAMTLTTAGNVGVGTTTPGSFVFGRLVAGTTSGNNGITIASGTTGEGTIAFADGTAGTDSYRGFIQYPHSTDALIFGTAATERMRITSAGNVGIGTTTPGAELEVVGGSNVTDGTSTIRAVNSGGVGLFGTIGSHPLAFRTNSTERMRIQSNGNVGIGTNNPTTKLQVDGPFLVQNAGSGATVLQLNDSVGTAVNQFIDIDLAKGGGAYTYYKLNMNGSPIMTWGAALSSYASNLSLSSPAGAVIFNANGGERMRIDSSGRVGIGTSTPASFGLFVVNTAALGSAQADGLNLAVNGSFRGSLIGTGTTYSYAGVAANSLWLYSASNPMYIGPDGATHVAVVTNGNERMRINSSGQVIVGSTTTTNNARFEVYQASANWAFGIRNAANDSGIFITNGSGTAGYTAMGFYNNGTSFSFCGAITPSGTGTTYSTSSDYRLKENISPMTGALAKIALLKPVTYKWKTDGSDGQGFIAHELQEVVPECVIGEKDELDKKGKPKYQGVDTSFLVATLTAAIQELKAELDSVKAELQTLKGN